MLELLFTTGKKMKTELTFKINGEELKNARKWIKEQVTKYGGASGTIGDRFSYIFTPTAIGTAVGVRDSLTGIEKNITDYSNW